MLSLLKLDRRVKMCILMHMRTTLNIDIGLLREASKLTGVSEKTALIHLGLQALIARESAKRLGTWGGLKRGFHPSHVDDQREWHDTG